MDRQSRLDLGAENAARCLGISSGDKVFILTDDERMNLADKVGRACISYGADITIRRLEEFSARPITAFPETLRLALAEFQPTATYYIATAQAGELGLRQPLLQYLTKTLRVRHGHMIGITDEVMSDGLCADYDRVYDRTMQIYNLVRSAHTIRVTNTKGTDVVATFNPSWSWIPCHGRYNELGQWGNLPEGETFTTPLTLNGAIVADVLGDFFSEKYGVLVHPAIFEVADSEIQSIASEQPGLADELHSHFWSAPNGRRAGEFAIGTLEGLSGLIGNLLQDEKLPGLHVAFGDPYGSQTGADWTSSVHVDVVVSGCTIDVDGVVIMRDGQFTI